MNISDRLKSAKPSATLSITGKAKAMLKQGIDVAVLAAGEPDFDTPDIIKDAAVKAIKDGFTKYTPASGTPSLKKAVKDKLKNENNLDYELDQIAVSCGAKHSIYNLMQVILNPGDEVLIITPYWLSYPEMVSLASGKPVFVKTRLENGFKVDPDDIQKAVTSKTKAIIINSPSNPAGVVYGKEELVKIADVALKNNFLIISDEIYENILFDGAQHVSIASICEKVKSSTIVVNGVSKSFSMTGWRIGYMAGDKEIIKGVSTLQSHSTSNPASISQVAAECALITNLDAELKKNSDRFEERRDFLLEGFKGEEKIKPFKPEGAFYLFCDISATGLDSMSFSERILEEKKVAVIPGGPFGEDGFIRISFATDMETLTEGVKRIKEWIKSL